jgi:hypothetical protein
MRFTFFLFSLCLAFSSPLRGASPSPRPICYFIPPQGWEIAKLLTPSPYIQIGFVGKSSSSFRPSMNLAFEEIDVDLKEYVKAVKEIHLSEPGTQCRDLGKFLMQAGEGRLLEVSSSSAHGELKQFQAIFVKDQTAYILTAAASKEALPKLQAELIQSLKSLQLVPDLFAPLSELQKKDLGQLCANLNDGELSQEARIKRLSSLEKTLAERFPDLGPHWRFLVLRDCY